MYKGVKTTMVFHFYADENYESNEAYALHLKCLKEYSCILDKITMVLSVKDMNNLDLISKLKRDIISVLNCNNIEFIVDENTLYYEALTFKKYVIDRFRDYDGLVFFGHSKGYSNVLNEKVNKQNIILWIESLYYLNFHFIDEALQHFMTKSPIIRTFGTFSFLDNKEKIRPDEAYQGTFFWLNPKQILEDVKYYSNSESIEDIVGLCDRGYAERFCGRLYTHMKKTKFVYLYSHGNLNLFSFNPYQCSTEDFIGRIHYLLGINDENEVKEFNEFRKKIEENG